MPNIFKNIYKAELMAFREVFITKALEFLFFWGGGSLVTLTVVWDS